MSNSQRRKGKTGELSVASLLSEKLGLVVTRNLQQSRQGGHDLNIPGWALEVKRAKRRELVTWWNQALLQAAGTPNRPALAYRLDRQPWRFVVALRHISDAFLDQSLWLTAELEIDGFCLVVRETLEILPGDDLLALSDAGDLGLDAETLREGQEVPVPAENSTPPVPNTMTARKSPKNAPEGPPTD